MLEDRYGNGLTTASTKARDAYVEGVDRFLAAVEADESFALAHVGLARYRQVMGRGDAATAALADARANANGLPDRETGQLATLGLLLATRRPLMSTAHPLKGLTPH